MSPLGALLLAIAAILVPATPTPTANSAPAPWHWVRVRDYVHVDPHGYYSIREFCPNGYTAITGGLQLPIHSRVQRGDEYRFDDGSGSSWFVTFENTSPYHGDAWVVAECVLTSDLPAMSHNYVQVPTSGPYDVASATVSCLNEGEVVLTGGASWSNVNTRSLSTNGPGADGRSWHAGGINTTDNSLLAVEVYCVDPAAVPGYVSVDRLVSGEYSWEASVTCPPGTRILNGGSDAPVFASYPTLNKWTATNSTDYSAYDVRFRAWCVDAGEPTAGIEYGYPPAGSTTSETWAGFFLFGSDPAGLPVSLRCSLDGSAPSPCGEDTSYSSLASGPHEFVMFGQTPDGRTTALTTHSWTVDATAPSVTPPSVAKISLVNPVRVAWKATDTQTGIERYEAAIWRARADGTVTDWARPTGWDDLAAASVRLPALAAGETICVSVRARDGVGNDAPWTAPRCTSRPFDDRSVATTTGGWTRTTGTQYWQETATNTGAANQTLRRLNAHVTQVGVLATVCPTCGTVELGVAGTRVGRINLERSALAHQKVLVLPAFALRSGSLTVTSTTTGKSIRIDGVITIRTTATLPPF